MESKNYHWLKSKQDLNFRFSTAVAKSLPHYGTPQALNLDFLVVSLLLATEAKALLCSRHYETVRGVLKLRGLTAESTGEPEGTVSLEQEQ